MESSNIMESWFRDGFQRRTPMHLFLGIIKTVSQKVDCWLRMRDKSATFIKLMQGKMEYIQLLQLGWCKTLPYKEEKFGGWIAENFVPFSQIYLWFFVWKFILTVTDLKH